MRARDVSRLRQAGLRPFLPALLLAVLLLEPAALPAARPSALGLRPLSLDLPGAPAAVVPADVDGDGRTDLVVAVAYNQWSQIEITESTTMDDVEGLVEVLTIVPSLLDRREARVYLARPDGTYAQAGAVPLPLSVLSLEAGPPGTPVVALTDQGVSVLRLDASGAPHLAPLIADPPVLAGTGNFLADLGLVRDLSGDGVADLLLPARDGLAIYLGGPRGLATQAAARFAVPGESWRSTGDLERRYPLPTVQDVTGDGRPDLVFRDPVKRWEMVRVRRNNGGGKFLPPIEMSLGGGEAKGPSPVFFGDLDGDGVAEVVSQQSFEKEDAGLRESMKQVREPKSRLDFRRVGKGLQRVLDSYRSLEITGHAFAGGDAESSDRSMSVEAGFPGGFQELNGDGRMDLVTVTMDLTLPKIMGSLATKRLTIGLDFHVWCQQGDGGFRRVPGLDLSGKFRVNFNDLRVSQLSLFSGDFDGDGRGDFVQLGRGRTVTIHRGRPDCGFPTAPDATVQLREEPRDIALVRIRDLNGDQRSDLMVLSPRAAAEPGMAPPVRLDLYLSGGGGKVATADGPLPEPHPRPLSPRPPPDRERGDVDEPKAVSGSAVASEKPENTVALASYRSGSGNPVRTGSPSPGRGEGDGRGGQGVRSLRTGPVEALIADLPGTLLRAAPARDLQGRPGLALLVAAGKDRKHKSLWFFDPGRKALERLADGLHEEVNSLAAADLDGDGAATPIAGMPGAVFAPAGGGGMRKVLEEPDLDLRSVAGHSLGSGWPQGLPFVPAARAGLLELLVPGAEGRLARGSSFPLPLRAERPRWGLRLTSPPVSLVPGGTGPLLAAGPEAHGRRRLKSLVFDPAGGEPVEAWSLLPGEERLVDRRYLRIDGRPVLAVGTIEKIGIFVKKRFRLFWLERDRSRRGTAPALAVETDCPLWHNLEPFAADVDGDGHKDVALVHREGMSGNDLVVALHRNLGNGRFEAKPRRAKLGVFATDWTWGTDLSGDGMPDLLVLAGGQLHLYAGDAKGRPVASRPEWSISLGERKSEKGKDEDREDEDEDVPDSVAPSPRSLEVVDVTGDGVEEIVIRAEGKDEASALVVVRRTPV
ncbi:MAG TPA: VCBS repeat-containing protein [Thermoanaerobaculia bacterium]|nr:VCBS repeat-containing protein [Thermoanaerobaculia bacterium]